MATRGDDARHRAARTGPRPPRARRTRRDELDPPTARRAVWATRYTLAAINLTYGAGFVLGAPTESSTYRMMEAAARYAFGAGAGMWTWGLLFVAAAPLIAFGAITVGAPLAAATWLCFTGFNVVSGAYGAPVFAGYALLHLAMSWFVVRGRATTPTR